MVASLPRGRPRLGGRVITGCKAGPDSVGGAQEVHAWGCRRVWMGLQACVDGVAGVCGWGCRLGAPEGRVVARWPHQRRQQGAQPRHLEGW